MDAIQDLKDQIAAMNERMNDMNTKLKLNAIIVSAPSIGPNGEFTPQHNLVSYLDQMKED